MTTTTEGTRPAPGARAAELTRFLVFSASLRAESFNTRLARLAARAIEQRGGFVDLASMGDFDCPSFDQDREERDGIPRGAQELRRRLERPAGDPPERR